MTLSLQNNREAIEKQHGIKADKYGFYDVGQAIFMVLEEPDKNILVTVLTHDMIDGTIVRNLNNEEMKNVFQRWKQLSKQK